MNPYINIYYLFILFYYYIWINKYYPIACPNSNILKVDSKKNYDYILGDVVEP